MSLSGVARSAYRVACPGLMRHEAASVRPSILNLSAAVLRLTVIYDSYTGSSHLPGVRVQAPKSNRNPQAGILYTRPRCPATLPSRIICPTGRAWLGVQ